jgi:hypothetical protein
MSDYLVSRSFVPNHQDAQPKPAGPAIRALQATNLKLEESLPQPQPVPAYQPPRKIGGA